tara:strand:- start:436 stop:768 length:333 start_codon:yes stop_codon:yes gene_type:complete
MKKSIKFFGAILLASFIISSCGTNAKDIKLSDLDESCDYIEAMINCAEEMIAIRGDKNISDLTDEVKEEFEAISDKVEDIEKACKKKYTRAEVEECSRFEEMKKLGDKVR